MIERPKFQDWWDGRGEDASYGFLGCLSACEPIIAGLEAKVEQMHVQMAGILTAAFGWSIGQDNCAKKGDWGWSVTYQDVLELRLKTDARIAELEKQLAVKDAEIAGAFIAAAGHQPMIAIDPTASKVWVYCSCGFNKESVSYETDPEIWTAHIEALTPDNARAALEQVKAQARLEEHRLDCKVCDLDEIDLPYECSCDRRAELEAQAARRDLI